MDVDPESLRRYYASLSDEALMKIDRSDLVETARNCYDGEITQRRTSTPTDEVLSHGRVRSEGRAECRIESNGAEIPDWLEESAEVYSVNSRGPFAPEEDADRAREVLEAAGIPCYLDFCEDPPEDPNVASVHRWRIRVPGMLNMRATNVLDRDIFNDEFEATWRAHLEMLSDDELSQAEPREVFCGLIDRIERVVRAYSDERSRRGM